SHRREYTSDPHLILTLTVDFLFEEKMRKIRPWEKETSLGRSNEINRCIAPAVFLKSSQERNCLT
ncbi:MAG TPA: hypothetical protein VHO25_24225, partial [Polyangiaceae bacterium]|nr:hypothetical protein [Polyangiaceae bacterium]